MIFHSEISDSQLFRLIKNKKVIFGGNKNLKIFGWLHCKSGKRLLRKNRVFFESESEALLLGYRPCGNCLRAKKFEKTY